MNTLTRTIAGLEENPLGRNSTELIAARAELQTLRDKWGSEENPKPAAQKINTIDDWLGTYGNKFDQDTTYQYLKGYGYSDQQIGTAWRKFKGGK
jgi:hypothetical protein